MSSLDVDIEEGTYELVHGGNFTKLNDHQVVENEIETTEYLDLDMEVVEGISDDTNYYTTVDESQDNITFDKKIIITPTYLTTTEATATTNDESYDSNTTKISSQRLKRKRKYMEDNDKTTNSSIMKVINTNGTNGNHNIIQLNKNVDNKTAKINPNILPVDSTISNNNQRVNLSLNNTNTNDDNIDIFFQSMSHSVLQLPLQIQAKIKMDICKLISMAEIKYCKEQSENNN